MIKLLKYLVAFLLPVLWFNSAIAQTHDITNNGGTLTSQFSSRIASENVDKIIDNNTSTKYFQNGQKALWVQYLSPYAAILENYSISSANDSPDRDPRSWTLQGSKDGITWVTLDTRSGQVFGNRFEKKTYPLNSVPAFVYYRLNITENNGAADTQFSEWELWGKKSGQQPPAAPGNFTATATSSSQVTLTWTDNSNNEDDFRIDRTMDGKTFTTVATLAHNSTSFTDSALSAGTGYLYKVYANNAVGLNLATSPVVTTQPLKTQPDITDFPGGVISDRYNTTGAEGIAKIIDNNNYSKFLTFNRTTWVQLYLPEGAIATQYAITSANDAPERDPKDWTFEGSNDGATWTTLHTLTNQQFPNRHQTLGYEFKNNTAYKYYRVNVTANRGAGIIQIAELKIFGTGTGNSSPVAPPAPGSFTATAVTNNQIVLTWVDNSLSESGFRLERSADGINWNWHALIEPNNTKYYNFSLSGSTPYFYRLRAESSQGNSAFTSTVSAITPTSVTPVAWQEHWAPHDKVVALVYENPDLNIYFDQNMDNSAEWMKKTFTDVWKYTRETYGGYSDPKLYAVMHLNSYTGGHPATVFDASHDYRNVIDMGKNGTWSEGPTGWNLDILVHEIGHIVEGSSKGVKGSPAFGLWGDSKWCEIFQYDVYRKLEYTEETNRWYNTMINQTDNFPRPGTMWFKNWFLPIYSQYGEAAVLDKYFQVLAQYFPKYNGAYTRGMNWGEFIHFWSGAAGVNLKQQATIAFGWPDEWEVQFRKAQQDFPFTYPDPTPVVTGMGADKSQLPETSQEQVMVWPNPSSGSLNVAVPNVQGTYIVELYSALGVKLLGKQFKNNANTLDTSTLKPGMYILYIKNSKGVIHTQRVFLK